MYITSNLKKKFLELDTSIPSLQMRKEGQNISANFPKHQLKNIITRVSTQVYLGLKSSLSPIQLPGLQ